MANKNYTLMELEKCNTKKEDKPLYCCFSVPQKDFLKSKGIKYELVALNPASKCTMWIYMRNNSLDKALDEWKATKPN